MLYGMQQYGATDFEILKIPKSTYSELRYRERRNVVKVESKKFTIYMFNEEAQAFYGTAHRSDQDFEDGLEVLNQLQILADPTKDRAQSDVAYVKNYDNSDEFLGLSATISRLADASMTDDHPKSLDQTSKEEMQGGCDGIAR